MWQGVEELFRHHQQECETVNLIDRIRKDKEGEDDYAAINIVDSRKGRRVPLKKTKMERDSPAPVSTTARGLEWSLGTVEKMATSFSISNSLPLEAREMTGDKDKFKSAILILRLDQESASWMDNFSRKCAYKQK